MKLLMTVSQVQETTEYTVDPKPEVETREATVAPSPSKILLSVDKLRGKCIRYAEPGHYWNPVQGSHPACSRSDIKAEACKASTPAVRLCVVLQNVCLVRMTTRVMRNVVKAWVLFG